MSDRSPLLRWDDRLVLVIGGVALCVLATVVVFYGLFHDRDTIVGIGLLAFGFGVVVSRLEGPFKFGLRGVEGAFSPWSRLEDLDDAIRRKVDTLPAGDETKLLIRNVLLGAGVRQMRALETLTAPSPTATITDHDQGVGVDQEAVERAADELADDLFRQNTPGSLRERPRGRRAN